MADFGKTQESLLSRFYRIRNRSVLEWSHKQIGMNRCHNNGANIYQWGCVGELISYGNLLCLKK